MKKLYYFLFIIFASFILVSCNNKNVERSLLNCRFVNAGLDDFDSVVFAESEDSIKTYLKGMEKYEEYNEAIVYPISREQFDNANKKVEELKSKDLTYRLFSTNCSS